MDQFLKQLFEAFLSLQPNVQLACLLSMAVFAAGGIAILIIVAYNPASVGSITSLITTTVLLFRGGGSQLSTMNSTASR